MATNLVTRLKARYRTEIRYTSGMLCMHGERYRVYLDTLAVARERGNSEQERHILQDLAMFAGEIDRLVNRHRRACERWAGLTRYGFAEGDDSRTTQGTVRTGTYNTQEE